VGHWLVARSSVDGTGVDVPAAASVDPAERVGSVPSAGFSEAGSFEPVVFSVMVCSPFSNRRKLRPEVWTFDRPRL
jgi:hypothetical protein